MAGIKGMANRKKTNTNQETQKLRGKEYIAYICSLYGDYYDDRDEDSKIGGGDWQPGKKAKHRSLETFRQELKEQGIELSTAKIRKILITGGCWSTERSREVADMYEKYGSVAKIAEVLEISTAMVTMSLPYEKTVYDLEDKSTDARRMERFRARTRGRNT